VFLYSVTHLPIKDINKHFIFNLGDTNNVNFSLHNLLNYNPTNKFFCKSRVLFCTNEIIFDITFKFMAGLDMWLIFDCFYAPRKKWRLFNHFDMMYGQDSPITFNIKQFYIDFLFSFIPFLFFTIFLFFFFYFFFSFQILILVSWDFVFLFCYILIIWKV
jgi:hypothetical protein